LQALSSRRRDGITALAQEKALLEPWAHLLVGDPQSPPVHAPAHVGGLAKGSETKCSNSDKN